jgi:hypothetical protein
MLVYTILGVFFIPVLYAVVERGWARLRGKKSAAVEAAASPA